jgi:hypothetical protein
MKDAVLFLELLTKRFPPISRHSHQLLLRNGKLQLNLVNVTPCWKFTFDDSDVLKSANQLVDEIARIVVTTKEVPPPPDSIA